MTDIEQIELITILCQYTRKIDDIVKRLRESGTVKIAFVQAGFDDKPRITLKSGIHSMEALSGKEAEHVDRDTRAIERMELVYCENLFVQYPDKPKTVEFS